MVRTGGEAVSPDPCIVPQTCIPHVNRRANQLRWYWLRTLLFWTCRKIISSTEYSTTVSRLSPRSPRLSPNSGSLEARKPVSSDFLGTVEILFFLVRTVQESIEEQINLLCGSAFGSFLSMWTAFTFSGTSQQIIHATLTTTKHNIKSWNRNLTVRTLSVADGWIIAIDKNDEKMDTMRQ